MGSPVYLYGQPGGAQQQRPNFIETLMGQFMTGLQIAQTLKQSKQAEETRQQQMEQHQLALEELKLKLGQAKLDAKTKPLETQITLAKLLQNLPGQQMTAEMAPGMAGMANVPEMLGGPGGYGAGAAPRTGQLDIPRPPISLDLGSVFPGAGKMNIPIETQQQGFQRALMQQGLEGQIAARTAGAKAGAEAAAKSPYDLALEGRKADAARGNLEFVQGQENNRAALSRNTSLTTAGMNLKAAEAARAVEREGKLSDDFTRDTKDFTVMDDAYAKIQAASKLGTGPGDIALIYGFMKLQDPGSTVREGEYATAQNSAGIPDRVRAAYNKAIDGEKLAPAVRANFVATAKSTYEAVKPRLKMIENKYQDRAKKQGVDPGLFKFQSGTQQSSAPAVAEGAIVYDPQGKAYKVVNGKPVPVQ